MASRSRTRTKLQTSAGNPPELFVQDLYTRLGKVPFLPFLPAYIINNLRVFNTASHSTPAASTT